MSMAEILGEVRLALLRSRMGKEGYVYNPESLPTLLPGEQRGSQHLLEAIWLLCQHRQLPPASPYVQQ